MRAAKNPAVTSAGRARQIACGPLAGRKIQAAGMACAAVLALAGTAQAQVGVSSTSLTCAQAAALVQSKGAVVFSTSPTAYDRYVRDRSFCLYDQQLKAEWVPTRDAKQCFVGYTCYEPSRGGGTFGH